MNKLVAAQKITDIHARTEEELARKAFANNDERIRNARYRISTRPDRYGFGKPVGWVLTVAAAKAIKAANLNLTYATHG